ncbi:MAG: hypothetical protein A2V90_06125 [Gammaproteobacteria bacterium RBG_16_57_12]|nr:MAG: hypothetical protein A2V90_06125 [Gammaproteobacteria bacterium RBG_16_57_12]
MTQVDFYILPDESPGGRELFACRLAEKIQGLKHRLYIHTASEQQAEALDQLLWTFSAGSFLPHARHPHQDAIESPILIGHGQEPPNGYDVLVNLAPEVPLFFSRFERVAELVDNNVQVRQQGRERFRFYKDRGYNVASHPVKTKGQRHE